MENQTKPKALPVQFQNIPLSLRTIPRWLLWNYVEIGEEDNKRWSKLPVQASGKAASSTNPNTWSDYFTAQEAYQKGQFDGVGFVFTGDDNIIGVDIDDCRDPATGSLNDLATNILANIDGYVEISPSETGIKIFTREIGRAHV